MMGKFFGIFFYAILVNIFSQSCNADDDNKTQRKENLPIVMVHGALASGDTYSNFAKYFLANDYPKDMLYAFDWNTLGGGNSVTELDNFINSVLAKTGKTQVYLMGHSAGGGVCYNYCNDINRANKIASYIHLASNKQNNKAGNNAQIPTLNIYSTFDKIVAGSDIPNAVNKVFSDLDHYEVATSLSSFKEIYTFLFNTNPVIESFKYNNRPTINGRVITLGENQPKTNLTLTLYALDKNTGDRIQGSSRIIAVDNNGYFGAIEVSEDFTYEFEVTSSDSEFRPIHYYREVFDEDNPLVYIRVFPPSNSFAGLLLSNLPNNDEQSVLGVFSSSKAMIATRDELVVQDVNLCNEQLCKPENSTIALFLYDAGNCKSEYTAHAAFGLFPFLKAADVYYNPTPSQSIPLRFNNRSLIVKNFKSKTEGVTIAVFD